MSVEQIEASIRALPPEEREQLANWFDEHRGELIGETGDLELSEEQQAEILRRRDEALAHPELLESFEEADVKRMFKEFADARSQKTSTSQG
jgi:hypothetical protein